MFALPGAVVFCPRSSDLNGRFSKITIYSHFVVISYVFIVCAK